jgi:hypothetical protein
MTRTLTGCFVAALLTATLSAARPDAKYAAPRTKDGRPDLQGVWNFASGVPLQRAAKFADRKALTKEEFDAQRAAFVNVLTTIAKLSPVNNVGLDWIDNTLYVDDRRTSLITYPENGRLPALVDGVRRTPGIEDVFAILQDASNGPPLALTNLLAAFGAGKRDSHKDFSTAERCLDDITVPIVPGFGDNYVQIIQGRDQLALVWDSGRRIISLEGKTRSLSRVRTSTGTSTGHWEGETLVVETRNFSEGTPGFAGAGKSRDKVVTERITRTSAGTIEYAATIVDPATFKDRVELWFPMARVEARIYEATCHEGNYSLPNTLSAQRKEDEAQR